MNKTPITLGEKLSLESLIDSTSLREVLDAIADICAEKADHIRCNWQDEATARPWADCGQRLQRHIGAVCYQLVSK
jgi:hypothetical protein